MTVIEVEHLHKRYGERVAVDDVSLQVLEGEIFGIVGPNGAGKTTTVESILGLRERDGGSVRVLGRDPVSDRSLRELVGAQLQEAQLPDRLEVGEALDLFASFYRRPAPPDSAANRWRSSDTWAVVEGVRRRGVTVVAWAIAFIVLDAVIAGGSVSVSSGAYTTKRGTTTCDAPVTFRRAVVIP
jgi:ABC-type cobalamin/Fe3+-siderophores transport system ATPase subunit